MKPGFCTSEYWVTVVTALVPVLTVLLHKDVAPYVQAIAFGLAAAATGVYTVSRLLLKKAHLAANPVTVAPSPAPVP